MEMRYTEWWNQYCIAKELAGYLATRGGVISDVNYLSLLEQSITVLFQLFKGQKYANKLEIKEVWKQKKIALRCCYRVAIPILTASG